MGPPSGGLMAGEISGSSGDNLERSGEIEGERVADCGSEYQSGNQFLKNS